MAALSRRSGPDTTLDVMAISYDGGGVSETPQSFLQTFWRVPSA